jgi:hypothetical protein
MIDPRILLLLGSLGLGACGGTSASAPAPSPTSDLAARYSELVLPPNQAGDRLNAASGDPAATITTLRASAQAFYDTLVQLNLDLVAFEQQVPKANRPHVAVLRQTISSDEADLQSMMAANSVAQFNQAYTKLSADDPGASATAVRSDLGLTAGNP